MAGDILGALRVNADTITSQDERAVCTDLCQEMLADAGWRQYIDDSLAYGNPHVTVTIAVLQGFLAGIAFQDTRSLERLVR